MNRGKIKSLRYNPIRSIIKPALASVSPVLAALQQDSRFLNFMLSYVVRVGCKLSKNVRKGFLLRNAIASWLSLPPESAGGEGDYVFHVYPWTCAVGLFRRHILDNFIICDCCVQRLETTFICLKARSVPTWAYEKEAAMIIDYLHCSQTVLK